MIREKLEALSDDLLLEYAATLGVEVPDGLERQFVVESILESIEDDREDTIETEDAADSTVSKKYAGFLGVHDEAPLDELDESCNETRIVLMLRDPSWAYAYWELRDAERRAGIGEQGSEELFLHVVELGENGERLDFFDIAVAETDAHWYLNLPNPGSRYFLELMVRRQGTTRCLARSGTIRTPQTVLPEPAHSGTDERLLELSGFNELVSAGIIAGIAGTATENVAGAAKSFQP